MDITRPFPSSIIALFHFFNRYFLSKAKGNLCGHYNEKLMAFFFISTICKTFILEIMFDQLWCIRIIDDNHGRCSRAVIIIVLFKKKKWSSKTRPEFRLTIILMSVILKVLEVAEIIMFILQSVVHGFFFHYAFNQWTWLVLIAMDCIYIGYVKYILNINEWVFVY